ncbi:MAG: calcium-translocating P-type ATPase, PMCA-type [Odoribacter splanchnicus]
METKHYSGLNDSEVQQSRKQFGENIITPPPHTPLWKLFLEKFKDPIIRILLVAAVLSLIISIMHNEYAETIGIFFIYFWLPESVSGSKWMPIKFELLNQVNDDIHIKVLRNGNIHEIPKREIVVGDIVVLETGEEIPADGELIEAISLQVNESTLTGEPVIDKTTDPADFDPEATYPSNKIMRGTTIVNGHCVYKVEKVGDATEFGKVAQKSTEINHDKTPLSKQLEGLAKFIRIIGLQLRVTFVGLHKRYYSRNFHCRYDLHFRNGRKDFEIFHGCSHSYRCIRPEGLPMSVTLSLALSMRKMLKTNNLVRKMHACETMGATTVICTDKTGTLTQNQMQVYQTRFYGLPDQELQQDNRLQVLIKEGISINSTAYLEYGNDQIKTLGNPTEAALLLWLHQQKVNYMDYRDNTEILEQLTFSTERKYMATLVRSVLEGKLILYLKGAPEIVFAKCKQVETPAGLVPAQEYHATVEKELLDFQNQAMRTLGFAYKLVDSASEGEIEAIAQEDFIFLGIAAISDPVRPDVPAAVAKCLNAGIDVKIVTGDTPATAREIGRQIGIWKSEDSEEQIITGVDFEKLPDEEAAKRVLKLKIMCRARPTDKQRLVELLKQSGAVVAVTGDGTNDAPALNHADVGLSMGSGTSVAKEASDITLLDDSFNSIATAVMWGRSLYHNIQRFILFQLTINLSALLIVLIGSMFGRELPLTVTQMLWVNMIIDTFAAAALASLPPNPKVMNEMPRKSTDFIISPKMRNYILGIGLSFTVLLLGLMYWFTINDGVMSRHDLSVFFTTFVMLQFWNMFNAKAFLSHGSAFKNLKDSTGFLIVMFIIPIGQYLIVQFGGEVFRTVPLSWKDWGIIVGLTSLVLWIGEILRLMKKQ